MAELIFASIYICFVSHAGTHTCEGKLFMQMLKEQTNENKDEQIELNKTIYALACYI